ncbi:MAG: SDR family oxidoreductase [Bacteroidetes bacterium]|nr:SDR family oxidoreductase [Bacteroidota bacterium]
MAGNKKNWALILGASSGFGGATSIELAKTGFNIFGVHLDRAATMPQVNEIIGKVKANGANAVFMNINAADEKAREKALDEMKGLLSQDKGSSIKVVMHSLAFGSLGPYFGKAAEDSLNQKKIEMTLDVMANSLVYWTQGVFFRGMLGKGARIFAMTSSGGHTVLPNYGAVSAAKAAIESHIRQIAMELGHLGVTANSIMAGVTDTPALRKIPNSIPMLEIAKRKNPAGRQTTPEDVAKAVALLCDERANFISGNLIGVDGGEDIVSYIGQNSPRDLGKEVI